MVMTACTLKHSKHSNVNTFFHFLNIALLSKIVEHILQDMFVQGWYRIQDLCATVDVFAVSMCSRPFTKGIILV